MAGSLGPLTPTSDPLRRLRGWQALAQDIEPHLAAHQASRIIADRRATAALLSWHFHGQDVTIMIHDRDGVPHQRRQSCRQSNGKAVQAKAKL